MAVHPPILQEIQTVRVTWTGVPTPTDADWIGVYCPIADSTEPTKALTFTLANDSETWRSGAGFVEFNLVNMRENYRFIYWRGQTPYYTIRYEEIEFDFLPGRAIQFGSVDLKVIGVYPQQVHIALTSDPSQIRVMWTSSSEKTPVVIYYTDSNQMKKAIGTSHTYTKEDMMPCVQNGTSRAIRLFRDPGQLHEVVLTDLLPNTKYYYRVGTADRFSNEVYSFISPQGVGSSQSVNLIAFGDSGASDCENTRGWCEESSGSVVSKINEDLNNKRYDGILHIGDISYAVGWSERWEQFFAQIQPIASKVPYMVSVGNHEYDYLGQPFRPPWSNYANDSDGECGVPTGNRFTMPLPWNNKAQNGQKIFWYSFDVGCVHVVMIDLEVNFTKGSEQQLWLANDLKSVNRKVTPWVIVAGHRPMYNSANYTDDYIMSLHIRSELEDTIMKYGVDLTLWGHYHSYERTCPVYRAVCTNKAPIHVTVGMAGAELDTLWMPKPAWSMFRDNTHFGYSRLFFTPTSLHMQYVDAAGEVIDEFWSYK